MVLDVLGNLVRVFATLDGGRGVLVSAVWDVGMGVGNRLCDEGKW
jgi:hypothetical protein